MRCPVAVCKRSLGEKMKQHINAEQFKEVKSGLVIAFGENGYNADDITIGVMIEFLNEKRDTSIDGYGEWGKFGIAKNKEWSVYHTKNVPGGILIEAGDELCDVLWKLVKDILEKE